MDLPAIDARRIRYDAQLLAGSDLSPAEVVTRAVALQGQDLPGVLRAIAIRSRPGTTVDDVRAAFDAGDIVRSWPMRGTLFATTPAHLAAILHHTGERVQRSAALRRSQLGLDDATIARARGILRDALQDGGLTRADALALWQAAGIATDSGRGYHLIFHLAVDGLMHWGPFAGAEQQLVLTPPVQADPDDLVGVLRGYVLARGPVTADDAAWWLKLPKTAVRQAAARIDDLTVVTVEGAPGWVIGEPDAPGPSGVTLVPAFDEWVLGYAIRSLVASPRMLDAQVPGRNGVFRPAILVDGVVVGTWRLPARSSKDRTPIVELVERTTAATRASIDRALAAWPHG
ncbi:winged helix DNA-binding domain-containing protein [Microbacterium paludicola]|uniref:Winged helix DNA-binding domain-containing protein n=1 Tax=Microbacterium paludicola TaxID=300019 RepID=A0A4Y9FYH5_9MICO|nr:winged helix DNA-binding domain-containing protein [Microbacterium paludicola]MBF0815157.1 AlkZ family DNA glycosylase [Microbacterium paludicola]TFU34419.1 winged helix DNA-binding domain-containing protein [Microbacterium paludicola]